MRCSRLVATKHIICDLAHHWGWAFCCKELKCCSSKQATRKHTRASLALIIVSNCLSDLLQNWAERGHDRRQDTRRWGIFYFLSPSISWSRFSWIVCIFWCKASWRVDWQVNLLFQLQQGNIMRKPIANAIIFVYNNLLNLENFSGLR